MADLDPLTHAATTDSSLGPAARAPLSAEQEAAKKQVLNRLKRAYGQLGAVIAAVGSDADCRTVVTQLAAVSSAVERAGFAIVATGMKRCLTADPMASTEPNERSRPEADLASADELSIEDLEKLFMMLS